MREHSPGDARPSGPRPLVRDPASLDGAPAPLQQASESPTSSPAASARWSGVGAGVGAVAVSFGFGWALWALLRSLLVQGWAHSFDAAIYVRSLWGVAAGDLWNPVVELHVVSIHFNLVLWLLAPWTRWAHPLEVLIAAQSLALAVTLAAAGIAALRCAGRGAAMGVPLVLGLSPLVVNPFLFDVRPDLLGVPIVAVCLLRARELGRWTPATVWGMLPALLVREELMMAIVGALVLSPFGPFRRADAALRAGGAGAAVAVWATYWFGVRRWLADGSYGKAQEVAADFFDAGGASLMQLMGYRVELVLLAALAGGGLALVGWRWLGAALPGLAFLLVASRMQELTAQLHYVLFLVPGLVVATVEGAHRLSRRAWSPRQRVALWALPALVTFGAFATSAAWPLGGRYRAENFLWEPLLDAEHQATRHGVRQLHKLAGRVGPDAAFAVPWGVAAPVASRSQIYTVERFDAEGAWSSVTCDTLDAVLLPARSWGHVGRRLVEQEGFRLAGFVDRAAALLVCSDADALLPWRHLEGAEGRPRCEAPAVRWPDANLEACDLHLLADGRVAMRLQAIEPGPARVARPMVVAGDTASGRGPALRFLRGLVDGAELAGGHTAASFVVVTSDPAPPEWALFVADGSRLVRAEVPEGEGWRGAGTVVSADRFSAP